MRLIIKYTATILSLAWALTITGDSFSGRYLSHQQTTEAWSEIEQVEERQGQVLVLRSQKSERTEAFDRPSDTNQPSAFHPLLIASTNEAALPKTPRFIQFCSYLN